MGRRTTAERGPYFRVHPRDEDVSKLLDPEHQTSRPWGGKDEGRCDKCSGSGETLHECESCKAAPPDPDCPACHGAVRYTDTCPTCRGSGEIDEACRDGVSVFPKLEGLYRYMAKRESQLGDTVVIELEGSLSEDEDFDADEGALLIHPTRVVSLAPLDRARLRRLARENGLGTGAPS